MGELNRHDSAKKYIRIDYNYSRDNDTFKPGIPWSPVYGEDSTIERICLCESLDGAITSQGYLNELLEEEKDEEGGILEILRFDSAIKKYGLLVKVYEFLHSDINEGNLVSSEELYKNKLVPDADITKEVWVLNQELKPVESYYIFISRIQAAYKCFVELKYPAEQAMLCWNRRNFLGLKKMQRITLMILLQKY